MGLNSNTLCHNDAWINEDIYNEIYHYSIEHFEQYWMAQIKTLNWIQCPNIVTQKANNNATLWFPDGIINACYNCVDRHAINNPNKTAIIWQSSNLDRSEKITYQQLLYNVCRFANTLLSLNLTRNNCVSVYMPMIPETIYACLACARLGIPYTVIFAGFSPDAIALRMKDCKSNFIITVDANERGGKIIPMKSNIDKVRTILKSQIKALIINKQNTKVTFTIDDYNYNENSSNKSLTCPITQTRSTDKLFIMYTSGSSGKPKGITMSTGGFLLFSSLTGKYFFNMQQNEIFWCTGDVGWMGGHAYSIYAALCNGITTVFFDGIPTYPNTSVFWEIIDKYQVTSFNTAPTVLRAIMQKGVNESLSRTNRASLNTLGVFGEVLNKDAWMMYFHQVGNSKCPIVNTWGQTELGGVTISPLRNLQDMRNFGHVGRPFFGCKVKIQDKKKQEILIPNQKGSLVLVNPLPGATIDIIGMPKISITNTGDEAYYDQEKNIWISGREDDVLNVSGHRISPSEIENTISELNSVANVAVIGYPHAIKGEGICAFVVLKNITDKMNIITEIEQHIRKKISPITKPDMISIVPDLPRTRSGKVLRKILKRIAIFCCQQEKVSSSFNKFIKTLDVTNMINPEIIGIIIHTLNFILQNKTPALLDKKI